MPLTGRLLFVRRSRQVAPLLWRRLDHQADSTRRDRLATAPVVSPRLADGCFTPAMHKPSRSRPAASAALLLLYSPRPTSRPKRSSRVGRPRDRYARNAIALCRPVPRSRLRPVSNCRAAVITTRSLAPCVPPCFGGQLLTQDSPSTKTEADTVARRRCRRALQDFAYGMPDEFVLLRRVLTGHQDGKDRC